MRVNALGIRRHTAEREGTGWASWTEFRRDFFKITLAAMISPLMYLMIFGLGIQTTSHGEPYLNYLIPGVVSMATMTGSFSAVAQNMSVQRLYEKALDSSCWFCRSGPD